MEPITKNLQVGTKKFFDIIDLTDQVKDFLREAKAGNGLVNIYTRHTTVAIKINEKEKGFFSDLKRTLFEEIANPGKKYKHNDTHIRDPETICPMASGGDCLNGHSHVGQMLLGSASETVPVRDGELLLGRWQRILMFELDCKKNREVIVTFMGEIN